MGARFVILSKRSPRIAVRSVHSEPAEFWRCLASIHGIGSLNKKPRGLNDLGALENGSSVRESVLAVRSYRVPMGLQRQWAGVIPTHEEADDSAGHRLFTAGRYPAACYRGSEHTLLSTDGTNRVLATVSWWHYTLHDSCVNAGFDVAAM